MMPDSINFNLNCLSTYRIECMGMATLLIIICHSVGGNVPIETHPIVKHLMSYCNCFGAVDGLWHISIENKGAKAE